MSRLRFRWSKATMKSDLVGLIFVDYFMSPIYIPFRLKSMRAYR